MGGSTAHRRGRAFAASAIGHVALIALALVCTNRAPSEPTETRLVRATFVPERTFRPPSRLPGGSSSGVAVDHVPSVAPGAQRAAGRRSSPSRRRASERRDPAAAPAEPVLFRAPEPPPLAEPESPLAVAEEPADSAPAPAPDMEPTAVAGAVADSGDGGLGTTDGLGFGTGWGSSSGRGSAAARRNELAGRIVGGDRFGPTALGQAHGVGDLTVKEATRLRTRDIFPPLPGRLWPQLGPYVVVVEICVATDGAVSEVALRRGASPVLDPMVLKAVRTWRYHPRMVDGAPRPFCHPLAIQYERL